MGEYGDDISGIVMMMMINKRHGFQAFFFLCFFPFYYYSFLKFNLGLAMVWQYAHHGKRMWGGCIGKQYCGVARLSFGSYSCMSNNYS